MCEMAKVINQSDIKARRKHWCYECGALIAVGETYQRTKGLWEDSWSTFATCLPCAELFQWVAGETSDCVAFGQLTDHHDEIRSAPRSMLSHNLLTMLDEQAVDNMFNDRHHRQNPQIDWVDLEAECRERNPFLLGLMLHYESLSAHPKVRQAAWEKHLEDLAGRQRAMNYYRTLQAAGWPDVPGGYNSREYGERELSGEMSDYVRQRYGYSKRVINE